MGKQIWAIVSGALFGVGLMLSGMTNPEKVKGFLDFFGKWDPTLMFVLGTAVPIYFVAVKIARLLLKTRPKLPFIWSGCWIRFHPLKTRICSLIHHTLRQLL